VPADVVRHLGPAVAIAVRVGEDTSAERETPTIGRMNEVSAASSRTRFRKSTRLSAVNYYTSREPS